MNSRCQPTVLFFERLDPDDLVKGTEGFKFSKEQCSYLTKKSKSEDRDFAGDFGSNFSQEEILAQFAREKEFSSKEKKPEAESKSSILPDRNGISAPTIKQIKCNFEKDSIYLFPCNKCDHGLQALHLDSCIS